MAQEGFKTIAMIADHQSLMKLRKKLVVHLVWVDMTLGGETRKCSMISVVSKYRAGVQHGKAFIDFERG